MQVSLENTNPLERRMTVSLPAERLDGVVGKRLQEIARTARLKGFRPGKIPAKVVEQRWGTQVRDEVLGERLGADGHPARLDQCRDHDRTRW